jgi:RecB family exonuclease
LDGVPASKRGQRLGKLWREEAGKEGAAARSSELERHLGPPERWPGYNIKKARAVAAAARVLERRDRTTGGPEGSAGSARAERFYSAYGGRLRGRADAVYSRGGRTEIEDYKTGSIYDEAPGAPPTLKRHFRRQLLLYAAMHHDETGEWPAAASVVPLSGPKERLPVDPVEAEREALAALALMDSYNERVRALDARAESLAAPSPSACRFCGHKLFCTAFWSQASPEWEWRGCEAVWGTVRRSVTVGARSWRGEVEVEGGTLENGVYAIQGNRPISPAENERFLAAGIRTVTRQEETTLVVTDYTTIRKGRGATSK